MTGRPGSLANRILRHTPLFAVDAIALDTETTGLDPRSARIVEIGAVRLTGTDVHTANAFQQLISIPETIPPAATAIHGIRDIDLIGAPSFPQVFAELTQFVGERPVIGHTIGFDLALLRRECAIMGQTLSTWDVLDVRLLAQVVEPALADFSLEGLAGWRGISIAGRHRALSDAVLAARIFVSLLPVLQDSGIRTFAEADAACRRFASTVDPYLRFGAAEAIPSAELKMRHRPNTYPYRHRVSEVMNSPAAFCAEDSTVADALASMVDQRISSAFVGAPELPASALGIVTERDVLHAIRQSGAEALNQPAVAIATRPLFTIPEDGFVFEAIGRMRRHGIRHLAAIGSAGRIIGALSARDLLRFSADTAVLLGDEIDEATDLPALARAWAKVPAVAADLLEDRMSGTEIAAIIARELGAMTRRAGQLAMQQLAAEGAGTPPCGFALLVLGSAGRGESLLALDQDNAIIFATGQPEGPEDRWFRSFGERVNRILHAVGIPLCSGGVMAGNPRFRGSLQTWRDRIGLWVGRTNPDDLLNVDIFFDFRPVLGEEALAGQLWTDAWQIAGTAPPLLRLLAETEPRAGAPLGFLGRLKTEQGRIDLKRFGLWPLVHSARLLALRHGIARHSTTERLSGVRALGIGGAPDLAGAEKAFDRFLLLILRAQVSDLVAGRVATNRVPPAIAESEIGYDQLRSDLRLAASLGELARDQITRAFI